MSNRLLKSCCEHGNEHLGSTKGGEFLDNPSLSLKTALFWVTTRRVVVNFLPTFRDKLWVPSSRVMNKKKKKNEEKNFLRRIVVYKVNLLSSCYTHHKSFKYSKQLFLARSSCRSKCGRGNFLLQIRRYKWSSPLKCCMQVTCDIFISEKTVETAVTLSR